MKNPIWPKFLQLLWIPVLGVFQYLRFEYDIMAGFRFLLLIAVLALAYDYLHFTKKFKLFEHFGTHTSATTTSLGMGLTLAALDYDIAKAAIIMMVLGDLFAGLVRRKFEKDKAHRWMSFLGCFFGCILGGLLVLNNGVLILVMALVASWMETKIFGLDDNVFMMLIGGLAGQALRVFLL